ncbi:MAG: DNA polymerase IV [Candidatus Peregrinibacteria bacterium]|nr:DNA polymerase IV [Candidatus Peregrinibacteria bacterium]
MEATILHVDADAFFASVEQLLEPKYRGKPLIVGGEHRGVVASASYEARRYGIHSAMPIFKAKMQCPHAIFVRGNFSMYTHFSKRMLEIFKRYTPTVEMTSIDEGYLDLSGTTRLHKATYPEIAGFILKQVRKELGITISGGLSTSKLVSKISSSLFKPHRLTCVLPGQEKQFLAPLALKVMPGIGEKTLPRFEYLEIYTLGDLAEMPFDTVWQLLGGHGVALWERAQGIDRRPVSPYGYRRKSISEEKTFPIDIDSQDLLIHEALKMLHDLCFQLRKRSLYAKTITLKIRYADFQTFTHQKTLEQASNCEEDFRATLRRLFKKRDLKRQVRLIGLGLNNLQNELQLEMFNDGSGGNPPRHQKLTSALDELREKYGSDVI